jgi:hypothetical protein
MDDRMRASENMYYPKADPLKETNPWRGALEHGQEMNFTQKGGSKIANKLKTGGFAAGMVIDTALNMKSGDDFGTAAVKGAFTGMLWTTAPWVMGAMELGKAAPAVYEGIYNWKRQKEQWWNQQYLPNFGGNYQDTRRALTMRQAAVEAIQGSKMNARSVLGGEARLMSNSFQRG